MVVWKSLDMGMGCEGCEVTCLENTLLRMSVEPWIKSSNEQLRASLRVAINGLTLGCHREVTDAYLLTL